MQIRRPRPADKSFRPSRARPWRVPVHVAPRPKGGGPTSMVVLYGFAGIIALGTLLLTLPLASKSGQWTSPVNALFTATSAVCVTGLVVVDTGTYWSAFGQTVILLLFQVGGFGFMTSATLLLMVAGRRIGLRERMLIGESMGLSRLGGLVRTVRGIVLFTLLAEGIGTFILFLRFLVEYPPGGALWRAVFHAVSAFNNAGFDLFGGFRSLLGYSGDATVLLTIAALIILGGISYVVVNDLMRSRRLERLSTDSKIVLATTGILLVLGSIFILLAEYTNPATLGPLTFPQKLLVAFFQAVTPRTAGFTAMDIGKVLQVTLFFNMFLMLVGGASGSMAGGVKVNTFAVLVSSALSSIRGKEHVSVFGRELNDENVHRALALIIVYLTLVATVVLALSITERFGFVNLLFETFSALGTVGLSTGITPDLSMAGRLIITFTMFIGRLGPLTFTAVLIERQHPAEFRFPKDMVRIG